MTLYRKTRTIEFADGTVEVKELSAKDLLDVELGGLEMDMRFFFDRCVGIDIEALSPKAYKKIAKTIVALHPKLFDGKKGSGAKKKSRG